MINFKDKMIIEEFDGVSVWLAITHTGNKHILVDTFNKSFDYCIYDDYLTYSIIGKFLYDLHEQLQVMELADGFDGVLEWLTSLNEEDNHYSIQNFLLKYTNTC